MAKRAFDIVVAAVVLVALSPLLLAVALAVVLDSPGPVFFRGSRAGRGGRPFRIYKFRSMVVNAAAKGLGITAGGDRRVTRVGRFLRRTKIDELPQLINVLTGEMSLVGPRPEDPRYVALYTPEQKRVLSVRPGITSPASVRYRHEEEILARGDPERLYIEEVMPAKLAIEADYLSKRTFWSDLGVIRDTAIAVIR